MEIVMDYEINVSKNGKHFFATAKRSATTKAKCCELFAAIKAAFPEPEYKVTCSGRVEYFKEVNPTESNEG